MIVRAQSNRPRCPAPGAAAQMVPVVLVLPARRRGATALSAVMWLALLSVVATVSGCGGSAVPNTPSAKAPAKAQRRAAYTDRTPEEWLKLLRHRSVQIRQQAINALVQYGKQTVPGLTEVIGDRSAGPGRLAAARALGAIGAPAEQAVPALARALADRAWNDRDGAAEALGEIRRRPEVSVPALVGALSDPDARVRAVSARAIGRIGSAEYGAVDALAAALEDADFNVQADAADALALLGPKATPATAALEKAARSQQFAVAQAAEQALRAIRGR